jgi:propionyl-CoA carboxylase beta chain
MNSREVERAAEGRLGADERIELLLDAGSFEPRTASSAIVAGRGTVSGRTVFAFATAPGSASAAVWDAIAALAEEAGAYGAPIAGLHDAALLPLDDHAVLPAFSAALAELGRAAGLVPRLSLVLGEAVGPAALLAASTDFVLTTAEAGLVMAGPKIVRAVTNERVTFADLGDARMQAEETGLADAVFADAVTAILQLRRLLDFLPAAGVLRAWESFDTPERSEPSLDSLVPADPKRPYDSRELVTKLVDEGDFFALKEAYAQNLTIGLGRLDGATVGIIASRPENLGGALDTTACRKAAGFVRFCGGFGIPLLVVADSPGFLPGSAQEHAGILAAAADLAAAFATARAVTLYPRNCFGAAFAVLAPKPAAEAALAWPSARIGPIGPAGARDRFSARGLEGADLAAATDDFVEQNLSPEAARARGIVDAVIRPANTRAAIIAALARLR